MLNECVMKGKSAQLFEGGNEDANVDNVQLTVNDDFARKLQVSIWFSIARLGQRRLEQRRDA